MVHSYPYRVLSAAIFLAGCQQTPHSAIPAAAPEFTTPLTVPDARAAVAGYLQTQPNPALYRLDSARVSDNETSWQVLVPRADPAGHRPSSVRFEVDKITGTVRPAPLK